MGIPKVSDINYAMAYAYDNNSNMYECVKFVRKNYPAFNVLDDGELERIWDAIDAYADILTDYSDEIILRDALDLLGRIDERECSKEAWDSISTILEDFNKAT